MNTLPLSTIFWAFGTPHAVLLAGEGWYVQSSLAVSRARIHGWRSHPGVWLDLESGRLAQVHCLFPDRPARLPSARDFAGNNRHHLRQFSLHSYMHRRTEPE